MNLYLPQTLWVEGPDNLLDRLLRSVFSPPDRERTEKGGPLQGGPLPRVKVFPSGVKTEGSGSRGSLTTLSRPLDGRRGEG